MLSAATWIVVFKNGMEKEAPRLLTLVKRDYLNFERLLQVLSSVLSLDTGPVNHVGTLRRKKNPSRVLLSHTSPAACCRPAFLHTGP